ncbi:hypothetical protein ACHAPT_009183 [Fusarium lateritium]
MSPNGQAIGLCFESPGGGHYEFQLWDLVGKRLLLDLELSEKLSRVDFSPDGQLAALKQGESARDPQNTKVQLIEVATGKVRGTTWRSVDYGPIFHPDSQILVSMQKHGQITVWDTESLSEKYCFETGSIADTSRVQEQILTPTGQLAAVAFRIKDGDRYASAVYLWDIVTGKEIGRHKIEGYTPDIEFSEDGRSLTCLKGRLPLPSSLPSEEQANSRELQKAWQDLLYVGHQWVFQGLTRLLWLPPRHQRLQSAARGETVALEDGNGGVRFIKFDLSKTPLVAG